MRGIVEDVLWEGGVLTTDEIYRGVKTKHAQLVALHGDFDRLSLGSE
jgi:hypothetical protein